MSLQRTIGSYEPPKKIDVYGIYASNYDCLINFLKPLAEKIQSVKKYDLTYKNGYKINGISTAASVEILFENFDESFFEYFMKFFDRDLRNAIDHESYKISNNKIMYKKKWIYGDDVFKKTVLMGHFISSLQTISIKYKCIINQSILDKKIKKKEMVSFLNSFIV